MPPKRGRAPAQTAPAKPNPKRTSKRAKRSTTQQSTEQTGEHGAQNDRETLAAFRLFAIPREEIDEEEENVPDDDEGEGLLRIADVRRCLSALDLPKPPADFFDDPNQTYISSSDFVSLAQTLRDTVSPAPSSSADGDNEYAPNSTRQDLGQTDEVNHAFSLFTHNRQGGDARIMMADLKRVARELREDVDDSTLRLMIEEANGDHGRDVVAFGVTREDFEGVMRRAGVF